MAIDPVTLSMLLKGGSMLAKNPKVQSVAKKGLLGLGGFLAGKAGLFKSGDDIGLEDIRTPEQIEAQRVLQDLAVRGEGGGIRLGEEFTGPLGEFRETPGEITARERLAGLFGGPDITKARETFTRLADTRFDPSDPSSGFASFSRALARSGREAEEALEREAAITGGRFGTAIAGEKADLAERLQDIRGTKLAELFQQSRMQQLAGAQGLTGLVGTEASLAGQLQRQSAIERQLKDEEARATLNEFKRQRAEELGRIDLLQAEANRNPLLGVSSLPGSPSPFSRLANSVLKSVGTEVGGRISSGIGKLFDFGTTRVSRFPREV